MPLEQTHHSNSPSSEVHISTRSPAIKKIFEIVRLRIAGKIVGAISAAADLRWRRLVRELPLVCIASPSFHLG